MLVTRLFRSDRGIVCCPSRVICSGVLKMGWIKSPILVIMATQFLFTTGDLLARANMRHKPFALATFMSGWFLVYFVLRQVAMIGQLYVFAVLPIGRMMAMFGAVSIVVVNILGFLLLGEVLSVRAYMAIALAVLAFVLLAVSA